MDMGGRTKLLIDVHVLIPGTCDHVGREAMWQGEVEVADGIKIAGSLTLTGGE